MSNLNEGEYVVARFSDQRVRAARVTSASRGGVVEIKTVRYPDLVETVSECDCKSYSEATLRDLGLV